MTAHPDDVDFGAAGTVASWTAAGTHVAYCIVTSGETGGFDDTPRSEMRPLRQREQRAAAATLGVHDVVFLDHPDGAVEHTKALRRDISRQIRRFRPQRVLGQSPEINWDRLATSHPDHLAVGHATLAAVYPDARNPFAHPELLAEGLEPWTVSELWMTTAPSRLLNHAVDITGFFDRKLAALAEHRSQTAHLDLRGMLAPELTGMAERFGMPSGRFAEAFHVVTTG